MFKTKSKVSTVDLIARDGWACSYCGDFIPFEAMTVDHVIPTLRGGQDTPGNTVVSCRACNASKGDMTAQEFNHWLSVKRYVFEIAPFEEIEYMPIEIASKDGLSTVIALPALWAGVYTMEQPLKDEWEKDGAVVIRLTQEHPADVVIIYGALYGYYTRKL